MELKKSAILMLIFIVLGLVFYSANNTIQTNFLIGNLRGTCYDSDNGRIGSEFIKGTVSGTMKNGVDYEREDYCVGAYSLKEYRCDTKNGNGFATGSESVMGGPFITCENGCFDGACRP